MPKQFATKFPVESSLCTLPMTSKLIQHESVTCIMFLQVLVTADTDKRILVHKDVHLLKAMVSAYEDFTV